MSKRGLHKLSRMALLGLMLAGTLSACKSRKEVSTHERTNKSTALIIEQAQAAQSRFDSFSAKVSADFKSRAQSNSFKATLRVKSDSAIWVSISPALGIEVFRLVCTADSVKYVDKLNNKYFLGDYKKLNELTNSDLNLQVLQNLLTGNLLNFNPDGRYRSRNDDEGYYLATRNTNRLRRVVGADRQETLAIIPDSVSTDQLNERRLQRMQERMDEDALIVQQYWFDFGTMKVIRTIFTDLASEISLVANYSAFEPLDGQLFPTKIAVDLGNVNESAKFKLAYSKLRINEPVEMPFSIPEKYQQVLR